MKKIIAIILMAAMVLSLAACSGDSKTTETTEKSQGSAEQAATNDGKTYTLKLDCVDPSTSIIATGLERFKAEVEEKSNGRLKIEIFYGSTLGSFADCYDNLLLGVSDIAWSSAVSYNGRFPCTEGLSVPFIGFKDSTSAAHGLYQLYKEDAQFQKEFEDVKVLALHVNTGNCLVSASADPLDTSKYGSMSIRTNGSSTTDWVKELGASPISLGAGDVYESISKNVVDMIIWDWAGLCNYKVYEQVSKGVDEVISYSPFFLLMNKDSYNNLPADLQAVIDECSGDTLVDALAQDWQDYSDTSKNTVMDNGVEMITLDEATKETWYAAAATVRQQWIDNLDSLGYDGQAVCDALVSKAESLK